MKSLKAHSGLPLIVVSTLLTILCGSIAYECIQKLEAVTGVGEITALGVLAELPELGTLNRRQAAALAGRAIHPRESGQWHGRHSIGGGSAPQANPPKSPLAPSCANSLFS